MMSEVYTKIIKFVNHHKNFIIANKPILQKKAQTQGTKFFYVFYRPQIALLKMVWFPQLL